MASTSKSSSGTKAIRGSSYRQYASVSSTRPVADHVLELQEITYAMQGMRLHEAARKEIKQLANSRDNIAARGKKVNGDKGKSTTKALKTGFSGSAEQYRQDAVSRDTAIQLAGKARTKGAFNVFAAVAGNAQQRREREAARRGWGGRSKGSSM